MAEREVSGLLSQPDRPFTTATYAPVDELAPWVDYFWEVHWRLPEGEVFESANLPHPSAHLVFEPPNSGLFGPVRGCFRRTLSGEGKALGVRFKSGLLGAFCAEPVAGLVNERVDTGRVLPCSTSEFDRCLQVLPDGAARVAWLTAQLLACEPKRDSRAEWVCDVVKTIEADRSLLRLEQLSERFNLGGRSLERLFRRYVGLSPKWVLRCYRLQQAANRLTSGEALDLAALAQELGYFDQAHFSKDFKQVTGHPPGHYRSA